MREHLSSLEHVDPTPFTDLFPGSPRAAIELLGGATLPNSSNCRNCAAGLAQLGTIAAFSSSASFAHPYPPHPICTGMLRFEPAKRTSVVDALGTMLPEAGMAPAERNALFPGRSCFPLSPNEDEMSSPASLDQLNVIFSVMGTPSGPFNWVRRPTRVKR